METTLQILAEELNRPVQHVANVVQLLDEGATIPFIARYRKELHGAMDDTTLRTLEERLRYLRSLQERRETVKNAILEKGKLTEDLSSAIDAAKTLAEVEDLYRPFKEKRRTRASMAREKGLEPLAELLFAQQPDCPAPLAAASDILTLTRALRRRRRPWLVPLTFWQSRSVTTLPFEKSSGSCWRNTAL